MASSFETTLFPIVQTINEYLSNYVLVILLLGIGIWYTIKTRCVQVRCFKRRAGTACSATSPSTARRAATE